MTKSVYRNCVLGAINSTLIHYSQVGAMEAKLLAKSVLQMKRLTLFVVIHPKSKVIQGSIQIEAIRDTASSLVKMRATGLTELGERQVTAADFPSQLLSEDLLVDTLGGKAHGFVR